MRVLGFDISSVTIGVAVAERNSDGVIVPLFLDHIRLDKHEGVWAKYDELSRRLNEMSDSARFSGVTHVAVETPLLGFSGGKSSADTIIMLIRMNILTSCLLRNSLKIDPDFIASSTARRLAGVKVQLKSICGKDAKTQVFEHMCKNDLSHVVWEKRKLGKRKGEPVEYARDITDAWVIAKARVQQG